MEKYDIFFANVCNTLIKIKSKHLCAYLTVFFGLVNEVP